MNEKHPEIPIPIKLQALGNKLEDRFKLIFYPSEESGIELSKLQIIETYALLYWYIVRIISYCGWSMIQKDLSKREKSILYLIGTGFPFIR